MDTNFQTVDNVIPFPKLPPMLGDAVRIESTSGSLGPIEKQMRSIMKKFDGTTYVDEFDWTVYDRLADKFEELPRGGVVFNTTFKVVNHHSSCSKCHYAFELDTYGRGCIHNCEYCYAKDQLTAYGYWNRPQPFPVNVAEIRKTFYTIFETDRPHKLRDIMLNRIPLRLGSMSDCFMWMDTKYGVTKEVLKILNHYQYPRIIFTRSDLVAHDDYMKLLDPKLSAVQFSISGNNNALTRKLEPGAPSFSRRKKALQKLISSDIRCAVRINPLFPRFPDEYYSSIDKVIERFGSEKNIPELPLYNDNFIPDLAEAGPMTIIVGFVRLTGRTINAVGAATGVDFRSFFKPEQLATNKERHFSQPEIAEYYKYFRNKCKESALRFSTCYIGNGIEEYFAHQDKWSNKSDCCDVKGKLSLFRKTSQEVPWEKRISFAPHSQDAISNMNIEIEADNRFALTPSQPTKS